MAMKFNDRVYPFTTEYIDGYMDELDVNDKSVLTVGSSCDQAFNCALKGAKEVSIIDLSENTKDYLALKRNILLNSNYEDYYNNVLNALSSNGIGYFDSIFSRNSLNQMNSYMKSEEEYEKMKEILKYYEFNFINGNIFELDKYVEKKYQRVIFSNVLQYLKSFIKEGNFNDFVFNSFNSWNSCITEDGIIQLLYLYSAKIGSINSSLEGYKLSEFIKACGDPILYSYSFDNDMAIFYNKRLQLKK